MCTLPRERGCRTTVQMLKYRALGVRFKSRAGKKPGTGIILQCATAASTSRTS